MAAKEPILYEDCDVETKLPWRWEICPDCQGNGKTSRHVECDGGGFTGSEWAEQDDDFKRDYLAGAYARACAHCDGGRIKVMNEVLLTQDQLRRWREQCEDDAEIDAIYAAERRNGA